MGWLHRKNKLSISKKLFLKISFKNNQKRNDNSTANYWTTALLVKSGIYVSIMSLKNCWERAFVCLTMVSNSTFYQSIPFVRNANEKQIGWGASSLPPNLGPGFPTVTLTCRFPWPSVPYVESKCAAWGCLHLECSSVRSGSIILLLSFCGRWVRTVILWWPLSWQKCLKMINSKFPF